VVGNLDQRFGDPAVDDLDAEDVGIGEGRLDIGLEVGLVDFRRRAGLGVGLGRFCMSTCCGDLSRGAKRGRRGVGAALGSVTRTGATLQLTSSWAKAVATRRASRAM
jgi:hypothetical protein